MNERATANIRRLIEFGVMNGLIEADDRDYTLNLLLDAMRMDAPAADDAAEQGALPATVAPILAELCAVAVEKGIIEDSQDARDRFGARLCGLITPAPAVVREKFAALMAKGGPEAATDWFYRMCRACDYIRVDAIAKNQLFTGASPYGELEITINLSKPEKDPRDIAAQRNAPQVGYPRCMLCPENPGYAGRPGFPARQNHRMIPLNLCGKRWYLQYSPYLYYNEHCIVLNHEHVPMRIDAGTFDRLFDFVGQFPHYFLGSNADLPIVGGSILSHDHFQGGRHVFPMDRANSLIALSAPESGVTAAVVNWPMSCVRLRSADEQKLKKLGNRLLEAWREWSDEPLGILARTDAPHNTVTPIVRREGGLWTLNLVLRNNRTDQAHPLGIFHPHDQLHHIKKENIGLIEVMGLFILPGRLLSELSDLAGYLTGERDIRVAPGEDSPLFKHYAWVREIAAKTGTALSAETARTAIRAALSDKCAQVLCDAGVYKLDAAGRAGILRFLRSIGYRQA